MAFTVILYSFTKKENSTARPSQGAGVEYSCIIKTQSGILNPTIELDLGLANSPANYNYAYIPEFGRYYFITEWLFGERLWNASLSVDVLATYKTQIGAAYLYVLRAANDYDGRVVDMKYPTKANCDYDTTIVPTPWTNATDGMYILGVLSKSAVFGSVNYIALTRSQLTDFLTYLCDHTITSDNGFDLTEYSEGLQLALVNPMQYIVSSIFIPQDDVDGVLYPGIPVFNYPVWSPCKLIINPAVNFTYTFVTKKHPQTQSRGQYTNLAPYTRAYLTFPPFGVIELDTTVICDVDSIDVTIRLDVPTGLGVLEIWANDILLNKQEAQIGVPIQLAQYTRDYVGAINNTLGAIGSGISAVESIPTRDISRAASGITGAVSGIFNAYTAMVPRANTTGSGGSYAQLLENARLDFQFFEIVDDDITQNGRPLCQKRTPASLGGYMLIQDGDVATDGTASENEMIRSYLQGGFYYE